MEYIICVQRCRSKVGWKHHIYTQVKRALAAHVPLFLTLVNRLSRDIDPSVILLVNFLVFARLVESCRTSRAAFEGLWEGNLEFLVGGISRSKYRAGVHVI
jgi:hypothetical protein